MCDTKISVREYCPITGNKPMICTRAGFAASCEKFQEFDRKKRAGLWPAGGGDHLTKYCTICKGDFSPENVTFIDVDRSVVINQTKKTEQHMPKTAFIQGTCDSCGGKKKVSSHYGKQVCYSCLAFRISAKNNPHLVIGALKEFGNLPDADSTFQPELNDYVSLKQYESTRSDLNKEIDELNNIILALKYSVNDSVSERADQQQKIQVLEERLLTSCEDVEAYKKEVDDMRRVEEILKQELRGAQATFNQSLPMGLIPDTDVVEQIAWKLAEGTIAGTITGVSLDDIRCLRSLV